MIAIQVIGTFVVRGAGATPGNTLTGSDFADLVLCAISIIVAGKGWIAKPCVLITLGTHGARATRAASNSLVSRAAEGPTCDLTMSFALGSQWAVLRLDITGL